MDTFRSCGNPVTKLQTLAVLWTLFGVFKKCPYNCQRWQFYGHCLVTANLGSYMDTFRSFQKVSIQLPMVAVLWTLAKTANRGSSMDTFRSFQKVQFCDRISTTPKCVQKMPPFSVLGLLKKVSIKLPPFAVLYHAKSSRCMATMHMNSEKCP